MVDPGQTLWYHSHVMEYTTEQVIMGTSGLIIVRDTSAQIKALEAAIPSEYAVNDFPLILQEKGFNYEKIARGPGDTLMRATGLKVSERPGDGEFRTVNGKAYGYLTVHNSFMRFRILNGDPRKSFNIGFSTNLDTSDHASRLTFYQIASDGGYMGAPHAMTSFLINPGERGEFLVDMGNLNGASNVYMSNLSTDPRYYSATNGPNDIVGLGGDRTNSGPPTPGLAFMQFRVSPNNFRPDVPITSLPDSALFPSYELDSCINPRMRTKNLLDSLKGRIFCDTTVSPPICDTLKKSGQWTIDNEPMDMMKLNDTVCVNTCEEWTVKNHTPVAHPFHIHKVQFQIKQYIDGSSGTPVVYDYPNLPSHMLGYKDVMIVRKNSQFTFQARFDMFGEDDIDPTDGYMYHCHILSHEDFSMMHQFTVVNDSVCQANGLVLSNEAPLPQAQADFAIYPNPAEGLLHLRSNVLARGKLRITDVMGRLLREEDVSAFKGILNINVADLPRGLIIVDFVTDNQRFTSKIILE